MKTRLLLSVALAAGLLPAQVTYDRLLHADKEPQNWLTYSGGYAGIRFSSLDQITPSPCALRQSNNRSTLIVAPGNRFAPLLLPTGI